MENTKNTKIGKYLFKTINNDIIFGETEVIVNRDGIGEFLILKPYTSVNCEIMPYVLKDIGETPKAIQLNPINVVWQTPLDEFPKVFNIYTEQTTGIITEIKAKLVI